MDHYDYSRKMEERLERTIENTSYRSNQPYVFRIVPGTYKAGPPASVMCVDDNENQFAVAVGDPYVASNDPNFHPENYAVIIYDNILRMPLNRQEVSVSGTLVRLESSDTRDDLPPTADHRLEGGSRGVRNTTAMVAGDSLISIGKDGGYNVVSRGRLVESADANLRVATVPLFKRYLPGRDRSGFLQDKGLVLSIIPQAFMPPFAHSDQLPNFEIFAKAGTMLKEVTSFLRFFK